MSPRHTGSSSILFFAIAKTLSDVRLAILDGIDLMRFLLTSRISNDVIWRICCMSVLHSRTAKVDGDTDSLGELAHGIVADIEVAEALALYQAQGER
jgi:hypothetical protein